MKTIQIFLAVFALLLLPAQVAFAHSPPAFSNANILIIRHGEKPDKGTGLSPDGQKRAQDYVSYFANYKIQGQPLHIDKLFAAQDTKSSARPRLTLTPLSLALGLPIDTSCDDKQIKDLVDKLQAQAANQTILICWHHGQIPDLLKALGANAKNILPDGAWPGKEYGWVIQLCYDHHGNLIPHQTMRIKEDL